MPSGKKQAIQICLFEDAYAADLAPLSLLRPAFEIKTGAFTLCEKIERQFNTEVKHTLIRPYLERTPQEKFTSATLFINGRAICDDAFANACKKLPVNHALVAGEHLVALHLDANGVKKYEQPLFDRQLSLEYFPGITPLSFEPRMLQHPWDAIRFHEEELKNDLALLFAKKAPASKVSLAGATVLKKARVRIGKRTRVYPTAVLNAEHGDIFIGENCTIYPQTYIEGPCYIGAHSIVKPQTQLRNASLGQHCRVSGEISSSVFHAFVNKQHEGFVGHSYFAPWVNAGAGTVTSNLKNNYSTLKLDADGMKVETGMQYLGTIAGDHTKFGINTMLNTGTIVGVACNIFGGDFPPKTIRSFSWCGTKGFETYDIEKVISLARTVMARRNETLSPYEERLLRLAFENSQL